MGKSIDIAGKLNAATTEGIVADAKQIRYENESTSVENKLKSLSEKHKDYDALGTYEENEEFIRVYTDAESKFLWGIRVDGSIEWAKGVPTPVQNALKELADKIKDLGGDKIEEIETTLTEKVNALQEAIDVINASLKPLTNTFSIISNDEWLHAVVDAENKLLFGIKAETGEIVMPKQDTYKIISNDEWMAVWVDAENKPLFGVKADGTFWCAKSNFSVPDDYVKQEDFDEKTDVLDEQIEGINTTLSTMQGNLSSLQNSVGSLQENISGQASAISGLQGTVAELQEGNEAMQMLSVSDDVEERTEMTIDADGRILSYRDKDGVRHEEKLDVIKLSQNGKEINIDDLATKEDADFSNIKLSELDGVQDHSLPNLFNKDAIRTYDSDFADKVFAKIGRKTADTGCYSNNIECKEGDWFTRSDFGTGIVVVLDEDENILGDVANAAYQPTIQITPSDPSKYDFSTAKYVVFVVMLENLDSERIVKAKYIPTDEGDFVTVPKLKVMSDNMDKDVQVYFKGTSGRYYTLNIDDSGESPILTPIALEGIPASELPSDFPTFKVSGDFSQYYDGLVFCPIEGGVTPYLYELAPNGLVKRYFKKKVNCPRILKEGGTWYYYGVDGGLNSSSGKLNIYKASGETFELVQGNLGGGEGLNMNIEPHDCLVISVTSLHYIYQRYVGNQTTVVDGQPKVVTSLHVGEVYDGQLLSEWHSEDYPELWVDSHVQGNNADYLHNNTICLTPEGNISLNNKLANQIIVLERTWDEESHTSTIGDILWKIGGNRTHSGWDVPTRIKTTTEQQWYECHDAVVNADGLYTLYDNKASGASRIVEFKIDTEGKQLTNFAAHTWQQYRGRFMGSVDKCADGIYLVSWGSSRNGNAANAGIYDFNSGKAIFEIRFDNTGSSAYRVYGIPKGE